MPADPAGSTDGEEELGQRCPRRSVDVVCLVDAAVSRETKQ